MTHVTSVRPAQGGLRDIVSRVAHGIGSVFQAFDDAMELRRDYERLRRMTDSDLARIGLTRDTISEHVVSRMG